MHVVGLTFLLFGGLALTVMTIKTEGDNNEQ